MQKSRLGIGSILFVLFSSLASASPNPVYGTWDLYTVNKGTVTLQTQLTFSETQVTMTSICTVRAGERIVATVTAPGLVMADEIRIFESRKSNESSGELGCTATVAAGSLSYSLNPDGTMLLQAKGHPPLTVSRAD